MRVFVLIVLVLRTVFDLVSAQGNFFLDRLYFNHSSLSCWMHTWGEVIGNHEQIIVDILMKLIFFDFLSFSHTERPRI